MIRIGIDVDEVVAKLHEAWLREFNIVNGTSYVPEDIKSWDIASHLNGGRGIFAYLTPALYATIKPYEGAWSAVDELRRWGSIFFVTNSRSDEMTEAKFKWLTRHGFLDSTESWRLIATRETKRHAPVDILIDDHLENVHEFPGFAWLVSRPHNVAFPTFRHRIPSLGAVLPHIRRLASPCRCAKE